MTEQDSSSSQSTSQSHSTFKAHSGDGGSDMRPEEHGNPTLPSGTLGAFAGQNPDYRQSMISSSGVGCVPYAYVDPYYGGFMAAYGAHSYADPQMAADSAGIVPARVPLPIEVTEAEPVYVNAKQYHRILRRRQLRAKLEAQNRLVKERKPYLHESRHLHAVKRARGSGGRFLNTKSREGNSQEQQNDEVSEKDNLGNSSHSTCSDMTSAANSNVFQAADGSTAAGSEVEQRQVSFAR
ncbi:nuclear transcription factor Y subunit A-4-like [Wolffia australiana]